MSLQRAARMWAAGVTVSAIAERLGVTKYQARLWVRQVQGVDKEPRAPGLLPLEEHNGFVVDLDYRRPDSDDEELLGRLADHQFDYEGDSE